MGRCRRHPSHLVVGVCAHCLNHRLLSLLKDDQFCSSSSPSARPSINRMDSDDDLHHLPLPPRLSASRFNSGPIPSAAAAAPPVATMDIMHHPTQLDDVVSFDAHHRHLSVAAQYPPAAACSATRTAPVISNVAPPAAAAAASPTRYYAAEMHSCCCHYNSPSDLCISRPIVGDSAAGMMLKKPASSSSSSSSPSLWRRFTLHLHRQFHGKDSADDRDIVGSTMGAAEGNHHGCCRLHPQAAGACIHHGGRCRVSKSSSRGGGDAYGADAPPSSSSPLFHLSRSSPQPTHQDRHYPHHPHHHYHHRCRVCSAISMPAASMTKRSDEKYCNYCRASRGAAGGAMAHDDDDDDDDASYGHGGCSKHDRGGGICYGPATWRIRSILSRLLSRRQKGGLSSPPYPLEAAKISFSERMAPPPPAGSPYFCSSPLNVAAGGGRPTDARRPDVDVYGPGGAENMVPDPPPPPSMLAYASAAASPFRRSNGDRTADAAGMPHLPVFTLKLHHHPPPPPQMYQRSHSTKWHRPAPPPHQTPPKQELQQQQQHAHRRSHHEFRNQYL